VLPLLLTLSALLSAASALTLTKREAAQAAKRAGTHAHASDMFDAHHRSAASFLDAPDYAQISHEVAHELVNELGGR
jgi:hypothetical protein